MFHLASFDHTLKLWVMSVRSQVIIIEDPVTENSQFAVLVNSFTFLIGLDILFRNSSSFDASKLSLCVRMIMELSDQSGPRKLMSGANVSTSN